MEIGAPTQDPAGPLRKLATAMDADLARRRSDLARAERALAAEEAAGLAYAARLDAFRARYLAAFGATLAALEDLEARIAQAAAQARPDDAAKRNKAERARARLEPRPAAPAPAPRPSPTEELRTIFRALTKQIHPDLADDEAERVRREALMVRANAAYAAGDAQALAYLAAQQAPEAGHAEDALAALDRRVALAEAQRARAEARRQAAEASPLARLMRRDAKAAEDGRDLFRKLAAELAEEEKHAAKRLRQLTRRAQKRAR